MIIVAGTLSISASKFNMFCQLSSIVEGIVSDCGRIGAINESLS
ncbi:hypothetical protein VOA_001816 [Vibrio sp. RC586]|nr:hypothetical protein VOA_001816 [Vibrio sp. RC586]